MSVPRPLAKCLFICDDVVSDPVSGKPSILNSWEIVRVPPGAAFPYTLGKIVIVAQLRGGLGDIRFRVGVVRADDLEPILPSVRPLVNFPDRLTSRWLVGRFRDVVFPEPGGYLVQLYCEGDFVDDRLITVLE